MGITGLLGLYLVLCLLGLVIGIAKKLVKLTIIAAVLLLILFGAYGGLAALIGVM